VDAGEFRAIGDADNRIVFEGASHTKGFWRGIQLDNAQSATFDYVDVKDAGQLCAAVFCSDVGVMADDTKLSFTNSSVSNSDVIGMSINEDAQVVAFANNRFYNNGDVGLHIHGEKVPDLDTQSVYLGVDAPNGVAAVAIAADDQEQAGVFEWKNLNAPYLIKSFYDVQGGIMRLGPGVRLLFGEGARIRIVGNGIFQAAGTAENRVFIGGMVESPGYWEGMEFDDSLWQNNLLSYVTLSLMLAT